MKPSRTRVWGRGKNTQRDLGHNTQRAFRANEELGQVWTGRAFAQSGRTDNGSGAKHGLKPEHLIAHRAVASAEIAQSVGAECPANGGHANRPRIVAEQQVVLVQVCLQHPQAHAALDAHGQRLAVESQDAVQASQVNDDARSDGQGSPHQAAAAATRNQRQRVAARNGDEVHHLLGRAGLDDRYRWLLKVGHGVKTPVWAQRVAAQSGPDCGSSQHRVWAQGGP